MREALGMDSDTPSKEAIKTTQDQSVGMFDLGKDRLAWPALLRKLERHSPDYKI